jgi:hypothetical protein
MNNEIILSTLREAEALAIKLIRENGQELKCNPFVEDYETGVIFNNTDWRFIWGNVCIVYMHIQGIELADLVKTYNENFAKKVKIKRLFGHGWNAVASVECVNNTLCMLLSIEYSMNYRCEFCKTYDGDDTVKCSYKEE